MLLGLAVPWGFLLPRVRVEWESMIDVVCDGGVPHGVSVINRVIRAVKSLKLGRYTWMARSLCYSDLQFVYISYQYPNTIKLDIETHLRCFRVTSLESCNARRSYDQRLLIDYVCVVQDMS